MYGSSNPTQAAMEFARRAFARTVYFALVMAGLLWQDLQRRVGHTRVRSTDLRSRT